MDFFTSPTLTARAYFAAALLASASCSQEPGDGTLTVDYQFGIGGSTCSAEGVETVRVTLGDEERTADCEDNGEITLAGVAARNYSDLLVEGVDAGGVTVRDNLDLPDDDEVVEVIEGGSTTVEVTLTPTPATIELTLFLNDASGLQLPSLDASVVDSFTIVAAQGSNAALLDATLEVADLTSAQVVVPDPERNLNGETLDTIVIGYDGESGEQSIDGAPDVPGEQPFRFAPPGDGRTVSIRITCNGDDCEGVLDAAPSESMRADGDAGASGGSTG